MDKIINICSAKFPLIIGEQSSNNLINALGYYCLFESLFHRSKILIVGPTFRHSRLIITKIKEIYNLLSIENKSTYAIDYVRMDINNSIIWAVPVNKTNDIHCKITHVILHGVESLPEEHYRRIVLGVTMCDSSSKVILGAYDRRSSQLELLLDRYTKIIDSQGNLDKLRNMLREDGDIPSTFNYKDYTITYVN